MDTVNELYFYLLTIKSNFKHWGNLSNDLKENTSLASINFYNSINAPNNYLLWATSMDPSHFVNLRELIEDKFSNENNLKMKSYLSIYERSLYLKNSMKIEEQIIKSERKYLIAYPLTKSIDWYLLPYEDRKRIMDEHIRVAMTDENNKDILSYTTYSFGIGDQEFVVYYETDSLYSWMKVTQRLREVEARKWIAKETPIYVGIRI